MYLLPGSALVTTIWGLTPFYSKHITSLGHSATFILFVSSIVFFLLMTALIFFYHTPTSLWKELQLFYSKVNPFSFVLWIALLYIISIVIYYNLLAKHHTFLVIALTSIYPLITLLASYYFFKESPKMIHFVAILLITAGVVILQMQH